MKTVCSRRKFFGAAGLLGLGAGRVNGQNSETVVEEGAGGANLSYKGESIRFGLVTYQWGKDWDLSALLKNCGVAGVGGVELRTTHAHGVEPELTKAQRDEVRRKFDDSSVSCLGPGSNERFDHPDGNALKAAIERTKEFIRLSHDIGGSGVKVKPNDFHETIPRERTIEQIGRSLAELADYAVGFGQEVRLEVHGKCAELPVIARIIETANHSSARVCWNSNAQDLAGEGLDANFELVEEMLGETLHVRELDGKSYPYGRLLDLLVGIDYPGWVMLEASSKPADRVLSLKHQREIFDKMLLAARARAT